MNAIILLLTSLLSAAAIHTVANDAARARNPSELHAAVVDIPATIDMSHADPLTWHTAPGPVDVKIPPNNGTCHIFTVRIQGCPRLIIATR
jgi:hypothetical protein